MVLSDDTSILSCSPLLRGACVAASLDVRPLALTAAALTLATRHPQVHHVLKMSYRWEVYGVDEASLVHQWFRACEATCVHCNTYVLGRQVTVRGMHTCKVAPLQILVAE